MIEKEPLTKAHYAALASAMLDRTTGALMERIGELEVALGRIASFDCDYLIAGRTCDDHGHPRCPRCIAAAALLVCHAFPKSLASEYRTITTGGVSGPD